VGVVGAPGEEREQVVADLLGGGGGPGDGGAQPDQVAEFLFGDPGEGGFAGLRGLCRGC